MNLLPIERALVLTAAIASLAGCGGGDHAASPAVSLSGTGTVIGASATNASATVPKVATCGTSDRPEAGLQGQVPASVRATGFSGYNCNLSLVGQFEGEGGNWSSAAFTDKAGRTCAYDSTAVPIPTRQNPGVPVIDITDATHPVRTTSLTTKAMLDPWESLRVNAARQILIADNGQNGGGGPELDIYDISGDCRSPQLLASLPVGTGADGGSQSATTPKGHEGNISPDGLTYYVGDPSTKSYYAVDLINSTKPRMIASFDVTTVNARSNAHGLSVSTDGNRMYGVLADNNTLGVAPYVSDDQNGANGFTIFDTSEVQQRKPNAQIKPVKTVIYRDGSFAQHTIPIMVKGRAFLVAVDEGGSAGLLSTASLSVACDAGVSPFPMARIFDINDEKNPVLVSKLTLETHDPKNCDLVKPDLATASGFVYGSHYCSVDNRDNATVMACSYFNSGIRVFDIRDPSQPKEIAYYNPASTAAKPGSEHVLYGLWRAGGADWCSSRLDFLFAKRQITTMCQDAGRLVLQFATGTWPYVESTASVVHN